MMFASFLFIPSSKRSSGGGRPARSRTAWLNSSFNWRILYGIETSCYVWDAKTPGAPFRIPSPTTTRPAPASRPTTFSQRPSPRPAHKRQPPATRRSSRALHTTTDVAACASVVKAGALRAGALPRKGRKPHTRVNRVGPINAGRVFQKVLLKVSPTSKPLDAAQTATRRPRSSGSACSRALPRV
jgi:hypothetical protein